MFDLETRLSRHAAQLETMAPVIDLPEVNSIIAAASTRGLRVPIYVGRPKVVIALAILALGLVAAAVTYALRSEVVEEGPLLGKFMEIEIAPDGLPFIVYSDDVTGGTIFAKCADRFCAEGTTLTRFDGFFPTVLMRDDSRPLIWIDGRDGVEEGPWLLDCDNPACTAYSTTEIADMPTPVSDIAESGRTLMTYWNPAGDLVIGTCESPACPVGITETVVTDAAYVNVFRAFFDPSDRPVLVFVHDSELNLVRCSVPDCSTGYDQSVVASGDFEELTPFDIAVSPEGVPWIVHGRYGVEIVRCSDETCALRDSIPLGTGENAWTISAIVGSDGLPLFIYNWSESTNSMVLKVARCGDVSCMKGTVATLHRGPRVSSFAATLDDEGNPVIAHRTEEGVLAVTCGDPGCTDGALEVTFWDHTETVPTTTMPSVTGPSATIVPTPPGDPATGPLFEPGTWIRIADFGQIFDCTWESTDDAFARDCKPAASSALGLSADVHLVSMANLEDTLVVITQACQTPPNLRADEPESVFDCELVALVDRRDGLGRVAGDRRSGTGRRRTDVRCGRILHPRRVDVTERGDLAPGSF